MQITIDTGQASPDELTALIALCASLGGRLPSNIPSVRYEGAEILGSETVRYVGAGALPVEENGHNDEPDAPPAGDEPLDPRELDSTGIPWDARIHSTPAKLNKDGSYRSKRGVSEVEFGRIHGELVELHADPNRGTGTPTNGPDGQHGGTADDGIAPPPPDDTSGAAEADAPPPPADDAPLDGGQASAPTADKSAGSDAAANATGAGRFAAFPEFVSAVNAIRPAPGIPYAELNTFANTLGVAKGFVGMRDHPELWEDFYSMAGGQ